MKFRNKLKVLMSAAASREPIWLEYLESDGRQWIDTGFKDFYLDELSCRFTINIHKRTSEYRGLLGCRKKIGDEDTCLFTNGFSVRLDWSCSSSKAAPLMESKNVSFYAENTKATVTSEGQEDVYTNTDTPGQPHRKSNYNFYLFTFNNDGAPYNPTSCRLGSVQLYDKRGLLHDFRPCLNPETLRPAMYDTVENRYYYNNGAGEFKYELTFIKLDYLSTHASSNYIDTEYKPNWHRDKVEYTFRTHYYKDLAGLFGCRESYNVNSPCVFALPWNLRVDWYNPMETVAVKIEEKTTLSVDETAIFLNGSKVSTKAYIKKPDIILENNFYLFNFNDNGIPSKFGSSLHDFFECKISRDGVLQRDFIPVRMNNGEICVYDYITDSFYKNKGAYKLTGYLNGYQVGESIESTGTQYLKPNYVFSNNNNAGYSCNFRDIKSNRCTLFGTEGGSPNDYWSIIAFVESGNIYCYAGASARIANVPLNVNGPNEIKILAKNGRCVLESNGTVQEATYTGLINSTMYPNVLANNYLDKPTEFCILCLQKLSVFDTDKIIRNLIPVRKESFIGMIDTLTMKEYANQGTGEFIFNA